MGAKGRRDFARGPGQRKSARGPGRPTSTSGLYAREKLIEAATELFAKQGVAATTFAMIAERAELTPAMPHYYFRDREQLLDAVVKERLAPLIAGVWGPVTAGEAPAELMRGIVEIDAGLIVFSLIGLVMMHMATINLWAEVFGRKTLEREALSRHITGLLIHGLQRGEGLKSGEGGQPGGPMKRKARSKRK